MFIIFFRWHQKKNNRRLETGKVPFITNLSALASKIPGRAKKREGLVFSLGLYNNNNFLFYHHNNIKRYTSKIRYWKKVKEY